MSPLRCLARVATPDDRRRAGRWRWDRGCHTARRRLPGATARGRPHLAPKTEEALIAEAHDVCYDLTWGWTPQQIADDLHARLDNKGVTLLDVGSLVNAAHNIYCPGNVCDAPACARDNGVGLATRATLFGCLARRH